MNADLQKNYTRILKWKEERHKELIYINYSTPGRELLSICDVYMNRVTSGFIQLRCSGSILWERNIGCNNSKEDIAYLAIKFSSSLRLIGNFGDHPIDISESSPLDKEVSLIIYAECETVNLFVTATSAQLKGSNGISYFIGTTDDTSFNCVKQASLNIVELNAKHQTFNPDIEDQFQHEKEGVTI